MSVPDGAGEGRDRPDARDRADAEPSDAGFDDGYEARGDARRRRVEGLGRPPGEPIADARAAQSTGPLRPPWPLAKRLNRNALTVAAALAGVTVLTVLVVTRPSRRVDGASGGGETSGGVDRGPPVPARPEFLDQPPRIPPRGRAAPDSGPSGDAATTRPQGQRAAPTGQGAANRELPGGLPVPPPIDDALAGEGGGVGARGAGGAGAGTDGGVGAPTPRMAAYHSALVSSVLVREAGRASPTTAAIGTGGGIAAEPWTGMGDAADSTARAALASDRPGTDSGPPGARERTVAESGGPAGARLEPGGSRYSVWAGTVVPGLLVTGINSDLPGDVLGQTSRDVFDSRTEQVLLIPAGSRLIGRYDNRSVATGRLVVAWSRLLLPDGRSVSLPRLAATDEQGHAGLHDQVDHHYPRVYGAALLTSLISAGVQLSQPQQSAIYAAPSSRQVAAGALGQGLGDVAIESARRGLDVPPTVIVRPGQPFEVFLSGDLTFDGPYAAAAGSAGRSAPGAR